MGFNFEDSLKRNPKMLRRFTEKRPAAGKRLKSVNGALLPS